MAPPLLLPVSYAIADTILTLHMVGTYSPADLRAVVSAALALPDRPRFSGMIADLRFSESIASRTLGEVTAVAGFLAYHAPSFGNRIAIVVPENCDDTHVQLATVDFRTAGVDACPFHDIVEARAWIRC